jgi:hypothetical protein
MGATQRKIGSEWSADDMQLMEDIYEDNDNRELLLFQENTYMLYKQEQNIERELAQYILAGCYGSDAAMVLWRSLSNATARLYRKEFPDTLFSHQAKERFARICLRLFEVRASEMTDEQLRQIASRPVRDVESS